MNAAGTAASGRARCDPVGEPVDLALLRDRRLELVVQLLDLVDDLGGSTTPSVCASSGLRVARLPTVTRSAAAHSARWSTAARSVMRSPIGSTVAKSLGPTMRKRRAVLAPSPDRLSRSIWLPALTNSWLTSSALVTSITRCRSPFGRKTARCRPVASRSSRCTPVRFPPSCADDLADEAVTLGRTETGDDGQPGMKVEREGAPARLDDDSLALHQPSNRQAGEAQLSRLAQVVCSLGCGPGSGLTRASPS